MAGITLTPELYSCAVNYVGIWDLEMLYRRMEDGILDSVAGLEIMWLMLRKMKLRLKRPRQDII